MNNELLKKYPVVNSDWWRSFNSMEYYYNKLCGNNYVMKYAGIRFLFIRKEVYCGSMYDSKRRVTYYKDSVIDGLNRDPWNRRFSIFGGDVYDEGIQKRFSHEAHYWHEGGISYKPIGTIPRAILYITSIEKSRVYCLDILKSDVCLKY